MKAKHLLTTTLLTALMMGGSMSPLHAQEAAPVTATCADDFTAAAYLPAELDSFITINATGIMELAKKAGLPEEQIPAELSAIESVAMGLPVGWEHLYDAYAQIAGLVYHAGCVDGDKAVQFCRQIGSCGEIICTGGCDGGCFLSIQRAHAAPHHQGCQHRCCNEVFCFHVGDVTLAIA